MSDLFAPLAQKLATIRTNHPVGRVWKVAAGLITTRGLSQLATVGDRVRIGPAAHLGEVIGLGKSALTILPEGGCTGIGVGDEVLLDGPVTLSPCQSWIGRIIDPLGRPLDGHPLFRGASALPVARAAPPAAQRRRLGPRLQTGTACFDTLLPIVRGQRIGLFAGSGVGKSSLLSQLARGVSADVVVIALVGERGRELREFVETTLGEAGLARSVVVAATSDQSPLLRRQCLLSAMTVAEHFRDQGRHVLFLADSVTRFAEAHREIALTAGEQPSLRGYPPSVQSAIMGLAERAGPGIEAAGDITAVFSVLVPGSDMEEPIADILRGVLDGHVVLDRIIAERGRFPAIDLLRSVSRSLPWAATPEENRLIADARKVIATWEGAAMMVQAGLYQAGTDAAIDRAIKIWPGLDAYLALNAPTNGVAGSFAVLAQTLWGDQNR